MYYHGIKIIRFYILDVDNNDDPQSMQDEAQQSFYHCPDDPVTHMMASQMRDMMNVVAHVAGRIGGDSERIRWYMKLEGHELLHPVEDYNHLSDG